MHNNEIEKQFIGEAFSDKSKNLLILIFLLRVFLRNLINSVSADIARLRTKTSVSSRLECWAKNRMEFPVNPQRNSRYRM